MITVMKTDLDCDLCNILVIFELPGTKVPQRPRLEQCTNIKVLIELYPDPRLLANAACDALPEDVRDGFF